MSKKAILVVSYGTSDPEVDKCTIGALEKEIASEFPEYEVKRAFTSKIVIKKAAEKGITVDYVEDAINRLANEDYDEVIVQPTHVLNGGEYDVIANSVKAKSSLFKNIKMGKPLLTSEADFDALVDAIDNTVVPEAKDLAGEDSAIVLMGHGTVHYANGAYSELAYKFRFSDRKNIFVTTLEAFPSIKDTEKQLAHCDCKKVVLFPLLVSSGKHVKVDMAGDEDHSLKTFLKNKGYEVYCIKKGMSEYPGFRKLFVNHVKQAISE